MDPEREPESLRPNRPDNDTVSPFFAVSIADIDDSIAEVQNSLSESLSPRSDQTHIESVHFLAKARFARYTLSQLKEDLDKSILHYTEAIFLPPATRSLNFVQLFFLLTSALLHRSERFDQPEDLKFSVEYLRYLQGLPGPLDSFDVPSDIVTTSLIEALATQVRLDAGDGTRNIKEIVVLCRVLLTSNKSADFPVGAFLSLDQVVGVEVTRGRPIQSIDEVIECLRDAVKVCPPGSYNDVLLALAGRLFTRFKETHSNDDYEEATALLETILDPNRPGECSDSIRDLASALATVFAFVRSTIFENPEYSELSISRLRTLLSSSSVDEGLRVKIADVLAMQARDRYTQYSLTENLEEANSYTSQVVDLSSSESLKKSGELFLESGGVRETYSATAIQQKIQRLEEMCSITPPGTKRYEECLTELADWYKTKFCRTDDISDIEESLKYGRQSLDATHSSDTGRMNRLATLRNILDLTFKKTRDISYLDESITLGYDILELRNAQPFHFHVVRELVQCLLVREKVLGRREGGHRDEAIRLMSMVIDNKYVREPDRFRLACEWAVLARSISHPTTLTAYKSAMSLMQKSLSFAPTVSVQHARLVTIGEDSQTMPLDYASYQINLGQIEEAVETLEQGRASLWSEMRGLRTPITQLIEEDSPLAKRFAEINQQLEALTISVTPSGRPETEDGVAEDGTDPFGRLVVKRQKLVEQRNALVSQIQGRPGLRGILSAPSFATLRSAASRGPVIIINHCFWSSDILIISHNSIPLSIPTADDFYARANKLRDELTEGRKHGLDSSEYQDALCSVLKSLYDLVGKPVIEQLRVSGVPEQSRIWWCPTSVFCSLPLHAMGPIPSSDTSEQYFSDLYIPSYTPSLSALIESRKASPQMPERPSLLLVAQPDVSLPGVKGEIKVIQRLEEQVTVTCLVSSEATPSSVVDGLRGSQLAHFACHGELETGKPFDASFKLHGGSHLTLLDIVRSRLPDAEFAFLSCCHTAEITEESLADEALHLTAAMQYCGFRSVVGTMWEMADTDGRDLAKGFYKSLFSGQETSVPYYERSAGALRDATQKLRGKRGITLERWVNFVHYGA
jgi:CHAT domain-containing protein/tetratricopeptide (TPR) repeat protein